MRGGRSDEGVPKTLLVSFKTAGGDWIAQGGRRGGVRLLERLIGWEKNSLTETLRFQVAGKGGEVNEGGGVRGEGECVCHVGGGTTLLLCHWGHYATDNEKPMLLVLVGRRT